MRQNYDNERNLLSFILAQFLLLNMGHQNHNIFVLSDSMIVTALTTGTGMAFFDKNVC